MVSIRFFFSIGYIHFFYIPVLIQVWQYFDKTQLKFKTLRNLHHF